ncbi:MAG: helix-turn-helix domain-containing protein [Halioglobus sp.]
MNVPLINTQILSRTVEIAEEFCSKQDIDSCLRAQSITREAISGHSYLPYHICAEFEASTSRKAGDPFFGVALAKQANYLDLGAYAEYVLAAPCLGDALERGGKAISLINPGALALVYDAGDHVILSFHSGLNDSTGSRHIDQGMPLLLTELPRHFMGKSWTPEWIELPEFLLKDFADAESVYSTNCKFRASGAAIAIKKSDLETPNPRKTSLAKTPLFCELQDKLAPSGIPRSTQDQVSSILGVQFRVFDVGIETIADRLQISTRTLQRKLRTEGVSFREVLSAARHKRGKMLLEETHFSVSEIAHGLGYEEVNSFRRAFINSENCTPTQYARQHRFLASDQIDQ